MSNPRVVTLPSGYWKLACPRQDPTGEVGHRHEDHRSRNKKWRAGWVECREGHLGSVNRGFQTKCTRIAGTSAIAAAIFTAFRKTTRFLGHAEKGDN